MISRLKLKRAVSSSTATSGDAPTKKSRLPLETPHPSQSSEDTAYKLPSSVGQHETPNEFSPLPVPTSKRLKENRVFALPKTYGKYGKKKKIASQLESPFDSESSPEKAAAAAPKQKIVFKEPLILGVPLSTVPTTLASAPSSPTRLPVERRPSFGAEHTPVNFDLFSPSRDVDFNRPPSQMSLYDYNARAFDADLPGLAQSTPKRPAGGYDTESDGEDDFTLGFGGGYETPDMDDDDWVSDSLISPPQKDNNEAKKKGTPPDPQVLQDLFDSLIIIPASPQRTRSLDSGLKDSLLDITEDSSTLAPALPINRTRSGTVTGRTRSGTIRSGAALVNGNGVRAQPTRTRSGTIVPGAAANPGPQVGARARSGSIVAPPPGLVSRARSGSIVAPAPPSRARSGSIIAAPSTRISMGPPPPPTRARTGSIIAPTGRNRSGSLVIPPPGRASGSTLVPPSGRNRSGSFIAPPRPSITHTRSSPLLAQEEEENSPDELDLILKVEPFPASAPVPSLRIKGRSAKIEQAKKMALKRCKGDKAETGEIGEDELLLK